ncbi:hypothetical protein [Actinoplanes sp. TFC3]|uniref:P-loop NTPase n=1 Tax=Actinoplanes sp. TFC3 TaxID=1710355 RepID=UPI0008319DE9|nr:hypothetical protein [Actinoplanes sp. TFC3]
MSDPAVLAISGPAVAAGDSASTAKVIEAGRRKIASFTATGGRLDALVLLGNLTRTGSDEDFRELDRVVQELSLDCMLDGDEQQPRIVAVPGPADGAAIPASSMLARTLTSGWDATEESFWRGEDRDLVDLVARRYAAFTSWFEAQHRPSTWRAGRLPGDGSGVIGSGDRQLRIVTINTSFRLLHDAPLTDWNLYPVTPLHLRDAGIGSYANHDVATWLLSARIVPVPVGELGSPTTLITGEATPGPSSGWNLVRGDVGTLVLGADGAPRTGSDVSLIEAHQPPTAAQPTSPTTPIDEVTKAFAGTLRSGRLVLVVTSGPEAGSINEWNVPVSNADDFHEILAEQAHTSTAVPLPELVRSLRRTDPDLLHNSTAALKAVADPPNKLAEALLRGPWYRVYDLSGTNVLRLAAEAWNKRGRKFSVVDAAHEPLTPGSGHMELVILMAGASDSGQRDVDFELTAPARTPREVWLRQLKADLLTNPALLVAADVSSRHLSYCLPLLPEVSARGKSVQSYFLVASGQDETVQFRLREYGVQQLPPPLADVIGKHLQPGVEEFETGTKLLARQREGLRRGSGIQLVNTLLESARPGDDEYLYGQDPSWGDIRDRIPARLSTVQEMWDASAAAADKLPIVILEDRSGTGKSTALMQFGIELMQDDRSVGWLDRDASRDLRDLVRETEELSLDAILVDDIDIFGARATSLLHDLNRGGKTLVVATIRSTRSDLLGSGFRRISPLQLTDADLGALVTALELNGKLGRLKDQLTPEMRIDVLRRASDQDLMMAMNEAIFGFRLGPRVLSEFDQLDTTRQRVYSFVCLFYALQYEDRSLTLSVNDLVQVASEDDPAAGVLLIIDELRRKRLVTQSETGQLRSRHRVIAEQIFTERIRRQPGYQQELMTDLMLFYVERAWHIKDRTNRFRRVMVALINHRVMVQSDLPIASVRAIYDELRSYLADDLHYWLQRGSYELEKQQLDRAATDVRTALGCTNGATDYKVRTTWGLIAWRLARRDLHDERSQQEALDAVTALDEVIRIKGRDSPHTFTFLAGEGVEWLAETTFVSPDEKLMLARRIAEIIELGQFLLKGNREFENAVERSKRELVKLLVPPGAQTERTIPL